MLALSTRTCSRQPGSSHSIIIFFNNQIIPVRVCFIFQQFKKWEIQTHLFFLSITEASAVWASQVTNSLFVFPPTVFKCCVAVNFWHLRSGLVPRRNTSNKTNMWLRRCRLILVSSGWFEFLLKSQSQYPVVVPKGRTYRSVFESHVTQRLWKPFVCTCEACTPLHTSCNFLMAACGWTPEQTTSQRKSLACLLFPDTYQSCISSNRTEFTPRGL